MKIEVHPCGNGVLAAAEYCEFDNSIVLFENTNAAKALGYIKLNDCKRQKPLLMDIVLCPWCGSVMQLETLENNEYCSAYVYECPNCAALSPVSYSEESARATALSRYDDEKEDKK